MTSSALVKVDCFKRAKAFYTTRNGGCSCAPFDSLNLGDHVGDELKNVTANRQIVRDELKHDVVYMHQVHSNIVRMVRSADEDIGSCDAIITDIPNLPLAVMTADCLPLLLATTDGTVCAAVHCGWRSLASAIVGHTVGVIRTISDAPIEAFMGPHIRQRSFEVGPDVLEAFVNQYDEAAHYFEPGEGDRYWCSLSGLVSLALRKADPCIANVCDCGFDTYTQQDSFFSYRRDHATGRMASIIML